MPSIILFAVVTLAFLLLGRSLIRMRAALRDDRVAQARLRLVAEHALDPGWMLDCASGRLLYVSPLVQRQFGYDESELAALAAPLLFDLPERIKRYLAGDQSRRRVVRAFEQAHKDGRLIPVEVTSTLVDSPAGPATCLVGVIRDVSPLLAVEQARKKFTSMLSHEFRSPLATIDGAIQRLEMDADEADEATCKRYRKIQAAVDRLLGMIDEHLSPENMAAIGRKRQPDGIAPLALLEGAAAVAPAGLPVTVRCGPGLPARLRCDPDGLRLCLQVLLDNAAKYTPAGSPVELLAQAAPGGGVELLVSDQGPGVPADALASVFDKFFRGSNSGGHNGSGLGLYMARSVVEVHGGTLTVDNRLDGGAVFRIWLPFPSHAGKSLASADCKSDNSPTQDVFGAGQETR